MRRRLTVLALAVMGATACSGTVTHESVAGG